MMRYFTYCKIILALIVIAAVCPSCEDFFNPEQELAIVEDKLYDDWYEYRSIEMGLYGLQQKLVEQLVVLGELRGDLLTITGNADADLVEIYNFNISDDNRYASPTIFFKLISNLIFKSCSCCSVFLSLNPLFFLYHYKSLA